MPRCILLFRERFAGALMAGVIYNAHTSLINFADVATLTFATEPDLLPRLRLKFKMPSIRKKIVCPKQFHLRSIRSVISEATSF